jgi:hypothetical protein
MLMAIILMRAQLLLELVLLLLKLGNPGSLLLQLFL